MNYRKDRIAIILMIVVAFVVFCDCAVQLKQEMAAVSNIETTKVNTTIIKSKAPKKVEEKASEIPQLAEKIEVDSSKLPITLEGVEVKRAVLSKATKDVVDDLVKTGNDPYLYNNLQLYVEGKSEDLEIRYNSRSVDLKKAVKSAIFEDSILSWYGGEDAYRHLEVSSTEQELKFEGFSEGIEQISNMADIRSEFLTVDGVEIKRISVIFQEI